MRFFAAQIPLLGAVALQAVEAKFLLPGKACQGIQVSYLERTSLQFDSTFDVGHIFLEGDGICLVDHQVTLSEGCPNDFTQIQLSAGGVRYTAQHSSELTDRWQGGWDISISSFGRGTFEEYLDDSNLEEYWERPDSNRVAIYINGRGKRSCLHLDPYRVGRELEAYVGAWKSSSNDLLPPEGYKQLVDWVGYNPRLMPPFKEEGDSSPTILIPSMGESPLHLLAGQCVLAWQRLYQYWKLMWPLASTVMQDISDLIGYPEDEGEDFFLRNRLRSL